MTWHIVLLSLGGDIMAINKKMPKADDVYKPFLVDINEDQKGEIESWILKRLDAAIDAVAERNTNIDNWYNLYRGEPYDRELPFKNASNVRIPVIGMMIDALHVRLYQAHFGVDPIIRINPQTMDDSLNGRGLEKAMQHYFRIGNMDEAADLTILDALIAGTGVTKTTWYQDWRLINTGKKGKKYVMRNSYPQVEHIPLKDFIVYPAKALTLEDTTIVGHRFYRKWDQLQRGVALGLYNEEWTEKLKEKASETTPTTTMVENIGVSDSEIDWKDFEYELYELIVSYDLDEDGIAEDYLVTVDYKTRSMIRFMDYPVGFGEKWYQLYKVIPMSDTLYGDSICRLISDMDEEITTLHNQRIDNTTFGNIPCFKALEGSKIALDKTELYPGKIFPMSDPNDLTPMNLAQPMRDTTPEEDRLMQYIQLRTGVNELNLGRMPAGEKTAYEVEAALAEGSVKMRKFVKMGISWLTSIGWQFIGLMKEFMDGEDYTRITGEDFFLDAMEWQDIWKQFDLIPAGNSTSSNRELERQKWVLLRESYKSDPLIFQTDPMTGQPKPGPGWYEINMRYLLASGVDDYEQIIGPRTVAPIEGGIQTPTMPAANQPGNQTTPLTPTPAPPALGGYNVGGG